MAEFKDVNQIVRNLTSSFNTAISKLPRASRTKAGVANDTYRLETEFAYLLNEVVQGPKSMLQVNIANCNQFIDDTITNINSQQK